ncbi:MAG: HAD family phosphatase [Spirochaetales bacterium]|nr:HAD family phosphatase [Spirochaetales bacterium]
MKYKCLILDHDDTIVDSSATVHYPAYLETMANLRSESKPVDLDGWFLKNFHPGILEYLTGELGFSPAELEEEYRVWRSYSSTRQPHFYPGVVDFLAEYQKQGGRIAVVSHSERDIIERDYRSVSADPSHPVLQVPELIFGWEMPEDKRKPAPWPVLETLRVYGITPEEALVLDDLKPAVVMARAAGVPVAGAGWGHNIREIVDYMKENCNHYFSTVTELRRLIFLS